METTFLTMDDPLYQALKISAEGDHAKAILMVKRVLSTKPQASYFSLLGNLYAEMGFYAEAAEQMQQALILDATLWSVHFQLGLMHLLLGQVDEAEMSWQVLSVLGQSSALYWFSQGLLRVAYGDSMAAQEALARGLNCQEVSHSVLHRDMLRLLHSVQESHISENTAVSLSK